MGADNISWKMTMKFRFAEFHAIISSTFLPNDNNSALDYGTE